MVLELNKHTEPGVTNMVLAGTRLPARTTLVARGSVLR